MTASLIVYDLDGVITTRDTYTTFTVGELCRRPWRLVPAIPLAVRRFLSRDEEVRRILGVRIARIAHRGFHDADYSHHVEDFGRRVGGSRTWIRESAVDRIRRQKAQGATIVIATATERRLAANLLEAAGVPYDLLSASELSETPTGMDVTDHRLGARKVVALHELGVDIAHAEFVTDSFSDLPTAREAGSVVLIGASARTRRQFDNQGVRYSIES
ncbi:haloacid dehalogenase-like hydrolase [Corynebacterium sp.]|jgi:phosphatidylglycerophosphatase C|uniref:haloacid dehalogenase-like hydrolase n=1 Tax=Corynebacterium sp. TaxID=1720 RepID=UPI0025BB4028|nr:haloacid dehalogenase-like hydrolase [Corynebacterium sp.]